MTLAYMLQAGESELICDMAETYCLYDIEKLPVQFLATLACGLREDSRIKMKLRGEEISAEMLMMAGIFDNLRLLVWLNTKDGSKGKNRPEPILSAYRKNKNRKQTKGVSTYTCDDFLKQYQKLAEGRVENGEN